MEMILILLMLLFKGNNNDNDNDFVIDIIINKAYDFAIDFICAFIYSSFC